MKRIFLALPMVCTIFNCYAQPEPVAYKYEENSYNLEKVDKVYNVKSTGQQFNDRLNSFRQISASKTAGFVSIGDYKTFQRKLEKTTYADENTNKRLQNFINAISTASDANLVKDGYRNALYKIANPVSIAIGEEWGDDITNVAITDAWSNLHQQMSKATDDPYLKETGAKVMAYMQDDIKLLNESKTSDCIYHVNINSSLKKEKIEVFLCEQRLSNDIKKMKLYPEDRLLAGPIGVGYKAMKDESASLLHYLNNVQNDKTYKMHTLKNTPYKGPSKFDQELDNNTEWYLYAFRNGYLYYSYAGRRS